MKKMLKSIALGTALVMGTAFIAGCGNQEKIGYVDVVKIQQESAKGKDVTAKLQAKQKEISDRLAKLEQTEEPEKFKADVAKSRQELQIYGYAMQKEFENTLEANVAQVARQKELTLVVDKYAVTSGATDITNDVLAQMGKATTANVANPKEQAQPTKAKESTDKNATDKNETNKEDAKK